MKRPWVLGAGVALITIVIGVAIVLLATSGDGGSSSAAESGNGVKTSNKKSGSSSTTTSSTTTTTTPSTATVPPTAAPTGPATGAADDEDNTPDPPNPNEAYQPKPLPAGVSATITSCSWSPANGGELLASGTITNTAGDNTVWIVTNEWLVHNQTQDEELDFEDDLYDVDVGQTVPWSLSTDAETAPPNLKCAVEIG